MATWSGGKEPDFAVYLNRDLFDTPENRVITSGLTLAAGAFWVIDPLMRRSHKPRK
jgi:hypothetical protein